MLAYLPLYDEGEFKRRKLGLKACAWKYGYLFPKKVAETYLNYCLLYTSDAADE